VSLLHSPVIVEILQTLGAVLLTWLSVFFTFSKELKNTKKELKEYHDVTLNRLNGTLKSFIDQMEFPAWIKVVRRDGDNIKFVMLEINLAYTEVFGIKRTDYVGKTDHDVWPKEIADSFSISDLRVWSTGQPETFLKDVNGYKRYFRKARILSVDGHVKGVIGYQIGCPNASKCPILEKKPISEAVSVGL